MKESGVRVTQYSLCCWNYTKSPLVPGCFLGKMASIERLWCNKWLIVGDVQYLTLQPYFSDWCLRCVDAWCLFCLFCWSETRELLIELSRHKGPYPSSHNTVSLEAKWSRASSFCPCCHFVLLYGLRPADHKKEFIKDRYLCRAVVSTASETKAEWSKWEWLSEAHLCWRKYTLSREQQAL